MSGEARVLTVVIHDVAPATRPQCEALLQAIGGIARLSLTLLVVPRYHGAPADAAFERWLDLVLARGHELALHGWTHRDDGVPQGWADRLRRRCYTAGEGEFAGLSEAQAARRLHAGRRWFAAHGWPLHGFVAPAWLMSAGTRRAVAGAGFAYTATLSRLIAFPSQAELPSQSLVYSTRQAWRRGLSLAWNGALARVQRDATLCRLELHPPDVLYPAIRASWSRLLEDALPDRQPLTVAQAMQCLAAEFVPRAGVS
jgi:hypothetical protein